MEPGAKQEGAMFVHAYSYKDLTEVEDGAAPGESPKEGAWGLPLIPEDRCQISHYFSELSTQQMGVAQDLQEQMLLGSSEDWAEPPGQPQTSHRDPQRGHRQRGLWKLLRPGGCTRSMS